MTDTKVKYKVYTLCCPKCKTTGTVVISFTPTRSFGGEVNIQKACYCKLSLEEVEENSTISFDQLINPLDNKINHEQIRSHKGNLQEN